MQVRGSCLSQPPVVNAKTQRSQRRGKDGISSFHRDYLCALRVFAVPKLLKLRKQPIRPQIPRPHDAKSTKVLPVFASLIGKSGCICFILAMLSGHHILITRDSLGVLGALVVKRVGGCISEIRTRRRLLRRIRPHLKEEAMIRPQATLRRVGLRPTANPKSEISVVSMRGNS